MQNSFDMSRIEYLKSEGSQRELFNKPSSLMVQKGEEAGVMGNVHPTIAEIDAMANFVGLGYSLVYSLRDLLNSQNLWRERDFFSGYISGLSKFREK